MNNQDQKIKEQQYNETDPQAFDRNDIKQVDQLLQESKKRDLNKSELNKVINILKVAKESRIVFINDELKKTENIYYETSRITKEIERFQATFPAEKQKSQQDFFDKAIKSDLDDLNNLLSEYQPILSNESTKSYFDGIQLVETSFVKSLKGLNIKYESPAELKAKQEAELKAKQEAELKAKQEAELKAKQEAELKAKQEAELKAKQEAELKAKQEAEQEQAKLESTNSTKSEQSDAKQSEVTDVKSDSDSNEINNKTTSLNTDSQQNNTSNETVNNEMVIDEKKSESDKSINENTQNSNKNDEVKTENSDNTANQNKGSKSKVMRTSKAKRMK